MSPIPVLTALFCLCIGVQGHVPVVSWSNTNILSQVPPIAAGHTVSLPSLEQEYLDVILHSAPQNIVLFVQDKLSIEDFTLYGDVYNKDSNKNTFQHLKQSLESATSSFTLPSVNIGSDRDNMMEYLESHIDGKIVDLESTTLKDVTLDKEKFNLIIRRLPQYSSNDKSVKDSLSESDRIIGEMMTELSTQGLPYTALLTANKPSKMIAAENLNLAHRLRREVGAEKHNFTFINTTCVYFYAASMVFKINDTAKKIHASIDLTGIEPDSYTSDCAETNRSLLITYTDIEDTLTLDINMYMNNDRGMWTTNLYQIRYTYTNQSHLADRTEVLKSAYITAPMGRSYHCDNPPEPTSDSNLTGFIDYISFQFQPFNVTSDGFSIADDCIGIFTPEVWMSLMTVLLMVLILAFGLVLLLSLSTMDRFDDPKGKPLTITTDD
ncbi:V-type proton ATPase subunit S1-like [Saccoglossus kowalevskii]|uniref:V-type proton ATPase subunit S1-like n=1 Tax=Saccoglossus kowalevskii TaxID=10224 RepID=A0ABM0GPU4_SACKO|nr:PREDICTED: V-type proton ATPase subunit S1-like [Saccoglossus kowalevskii]